MPGSAAKATAIGVAILALLAVAASGPIALPKLAVASRILSRPHRVLPGQSLKHSDLVGRLRRQGYRQIESGVPRPGEFRHGRGQLILHRRSFVGAVAADGEGPVTIHVDWRGNLRSIVDQRARPLSSLLLEPEVVGTFHGPSREDRHLVRLEAVPRHLVDAVLTVEDRRFFEHAGLDLRRLAGAMLANLRAGRVVQGGSTLTQQLVKNLYLDDARTLTRKLREAWLALRLERSHDKTEILEAYLNTIYLGQHGSVSVRGIDAASRHYFGKRVEEVSLSEAALLAGLIRGPGLYSPYRDPEAARARRDRVLGMLLETEHITSEEYVVALADPLGVLSEPPQPVTAPYFAARVEREVREALPDADLAREGWTVYTGLDASLQYFAQRAVRRGVERLEADFPELLREHSPLQAAMVVMDPRNGEILALVGGRDWGSSQFDRATQARRQPGSVFKPIVALAALSRGPEGVPPFTLASVLEDEPLEIETPEGPWAPENYDGEFRGRTNLRTAIERSINVPVARLGLALGPQRIIETARRIGIESRLAAVPSLALGAFELTALEVARAYAVLASEGYRTKPLAYRRVVDAEGTTLAALTPERVRVYDPAETALVTSALRGAVDHGTGRGLRWRGYRGPAAGKTGTTNGFRDAWFVGYTPALVAVVWVGFDDGASLELPGARAALPIFAEFIVATLGPEGGASFETPAGVEFVRVNKASGLRAGWGCTGRQEIFLTGTAPTGKCTPIWARITGGRSRDEHAAAEAPDVDARRPPAPRAPSGAPPPPRDDPPLPTWLRIVDGVLDAVEEAVRTPR